MKKSLLYFVLLTAPFVAASQTETTNTTHKRNTIYVEAFGQGLLNSFNYDRLFNLDKKVRTSVTAGITLVPHPESFVLGLPISYNFIFGEGSNHLELILGFTVLFWRSQLYMTEYTLDANGLTHEYPSYKTHENDWFTYFTPKVGYRYQNPKGGIFLRTTFTPHVAGINRYGAPEGNHSYNEPTYEYFTNAAIFWKRIFPWAGISVGYTLKK